MDLLTNYDLSDILIICFGLIAFALTIFKAVDYLTDKSRKIVSNAAEQLEEEKELETELRRIASRVSALEILIESDKSRIKGEIYKAYIASSNKGYIQPEQLEYLEQQYKCYLKEGGNSYVTSLMESLRELLIKS